MASFVKDEKRGTWTVRYRTPERRQTTQRGFKTKRDAQQWWSKQETAMSEGAFIRPSEGKVTVEQLVTDWLERKRPTIRPTTYRNLEASARLYVLPKWGRRQAATVRKTEIKSWATTMNRSTASHALQVLRGALDDAVDDRKIGMNPAREIELKPRATKERIYLSHDQVSDLLDAVAPEHRTLVEVLAYTGLRWGEATALRVSDVDMLRRRISITKQAVQIGGKFHENEPKTKLGKRTVSFPRSLSGSLSKQMDGRGRDDLLFPNPHPAKAARPPLYRRRPDPYTGWLQVALEKADLPRFTVHDLRHTAASLAVSAGANVKVLQRMLGHSSAAMTLDTYADLFDHDLDSVADALDAARASSTRSA